MATSPRSPVIEHLRQTLRLQDAAALTDAHLLEHFLAHRDEAAFAALVQRHGPMVLGVCRRVARHHQDAEDAFQATFLVLVRKAASIARPEQLANWLYGVAYNTALKARAAASRRRRREKQVPELPEPAIVEPEPWSDDLQTFLDQELSRLPDKYRVAIVLCDLEGKTQKEAAQLLGCPEGSLSSRLSRARTMLAKRMARHGLALSGGSLAALLSRETASGSVPTSVVSSTIQAASLLAAGDPAAGSIVSGPVAALTERMVKAMLLAKLQTVLFVVLGLVAFGGGLYLHQAVARPGPGDKSPVVGEKGDKAREAPTGVKAVGGLRILLRLPPVEKGKTLPPHFEVVLENVGENDLNVQLGYSLANGRSHHPAALRLQARSKGDKTRTLKYAQSAVAGRLDPLVVPLLAGSSYTLRCRFDRFADSETGEPLDLTARDYRIAAELVGEPVTRANPDLKGLVLMPFWQGKVRSNEVVPLPFAGKESDK
jgi:RNA polymerase sigma factor (sigma-70 family)